MPLNIPLDHRDEEQRRDDYNDSCAAFDSVFQDKVDAIHDLYHHVKNIMEEDLVKGVHDKLIEIIVGEATRLAREMEDTWNGDIPGSCHCDPDSDYYEELFDIIRTEQG